MDHDSSCNVSEGTPNRGLSLYEAARLFNVPFTTDARPRDGEVEAGGLRFHYLEWGRNDAPPALLLHGIGQQCHSWDFISLALSDRYRIIALDARGHGDTQWPDDGDYSLEAHQRDLDAVVEAMGLKDFVLIGHSMGGRNGYVFASRRPELVKALVIVDTGPGQVAASSRRIRASSPSPTNSIPTRSLSSESGSIRGGPYGLFMEAFNIPSKRCPTASGLGSMTRRFVARTSSLKAGPPRTYGAVSRPLSAPSWWLEGPIATFCPRRCLRKC